MKVKELIELLQKCNPDDTVMYDAQNALQNEDWHLMDCAGDDVTERPDFGISDVLYGTGTLRGRVYLCEESYPEMEGQQMQAEDKHTIGAKKEIVSYEDFKIDVKDITLLSKEEYDKYKDIIPPVNLWWWLRSPGYNSLDAASVTSDGSLLYIYVSHSSLYVRPAIVCEPSCLEPGDKVKLFEMNWTALNPSLLLCDESIGGCAFRKDWNAPDANDYDASDVKRYLREWIYREDGK